jgi:hypothetical protein
MYAHSMSCSPYTYDYYEFLEDNDLLDYLVITFVNKYKTFNSYLFNP